MEETAQTKKENKMNTDEQGSPPRKQEKIAEKAEEKTAMHSDKALSDKFKSLLR